MRTAIFLSLFLSVATVPTLFAQPALAKLAHVVACAGWQDAGDRERAANRRAPVDVRNPRTPDQDIPADGTSKNHPATRPNREPNGVQNGRSHWNVLIRISAAITGIVLAITGLIRAFRKRD